MALMKPTKYRKKPVVIEAMQWDGENLINILQWCHAGMPPEANAVVRSDGGFLRIRTLEGEMTATKSDWVIRGVRGEFYPCKPDIFEATYTLAEDVR